MSEVNYGIEDFMAEQERCEAENWGDEDDEDVVAAEENYLNSWEYHTFKLISENSLFESIKTGSNGRFFLIDRYEEENKWDQAFVYYTALDKESNRFIRFYQEIGSDDFDLDGEVFPVKKIEFTSLLSLGTSLTINERDNFIRDIKEDRNQWRNLL